LGDGGFAEDGDGLTRLRVIRSLSSGSGCNFHAKASPKTAYLRLFQR